MQVHDQLPTFWDRNRILIKGLMTGFLILIMLIPTAFLSELISEREMRQEQVVNEVSSKWASEQTLKGPVLYVPYKVYTQKEGKVFQSIEHMYLLPEQLSVNGKLMPEVRHRSLYSVTLYRSDIRLTGKFSPLPFEKMQVPQENIMWNDARLLIGIDDARGLEEEVAVNWTGQQKIFEAGVPENTVITSGLSVPIVLTPGENTFSINVKLKGSGHFYVTPVGKTTEVKLSSTWANPAFDGQYLPVQSNVTDKGFDAQWKVLQVSRNYPQYWTKGSSYQVEASSFGVKLIQPTDGYSKTRRSVKYAILFIALTFTIFFFLEILQKKQIHALQYILVGFALCIFYTLLLSISEYTGFNPAYFIAASATVILIGLYAWSIFKQLKVALGFTIAIGSLYGYIFILIQLQDYALLFGSIGLFVILAVIMFYSRKIDWYSTGRAHHEKELS